MHQHLIAVSHDTALLRIHLHVLCWTAEASSEMRHSCSSGWATFVQGPSVAVRLLCFIPSLSAALQSNILYVGGIPAQSLQLLLVKGLLRVVLETYLLQKPSYTLRNRLGLGFVQYSTLSPSSQNPSGSMLGSSQGHLKERQSVSNKMFGPPTGMFLSGRYEPGHSEEFSLS